MILKYKRGTHPNSHKPTKESKLKRSEKLKGRTWTKKQNQKRSKALMGHKHSIKTIEKIKQSLKKTFPDGRPINSGCFTTEKTKGEKNNNWNGGISLGIYSEDWNENLKQIIKTRDNFTCQLCEFKKETPRRIKNKPSKNWLVVHHIDYNKKNSNPKNLITLCHKCHIQTNRNRKIWLKVFSRIQELKRPLPILIEMGELL